MNRQTGLILTIASALLCGCPGLGACAWGVIFAISGPAGTASFTSGGVTTPMDPTTAIGVGVGSICVGLIFVIIPVALWYFTVRGKPAAGTPTM